jgi:hypothetical protein
MAFLTQNKAKLFKIWSKHWFLRKPAFSPKKIVEHCRKSQKIVIIPLTPAFFSVIQYYCKLLCKYFA